MNASEDEPVSKGGPAPLTIADYHRRTKRDFGHMALSPGYLERAGQPAPCHHS